MKRKKKSFIDKKLKNTTNKKLTLIIGVITIILMIIFGIPAYFLLQKEPTRIDITDVRVGDTNVDCNNRGSVNLFYTISYISGPRLGKGLPYYLFLNQTKNTCKENYTFFYKKGKAMCYNSYDYGVRSTNCASGFFPLGEVPVLTQSYLNNETNRFFDDINITESCEISEVIKVCGSIDDQQFCSLPHEISLKFMHCT